MWTNDKCSWQFDMKVCAIQTLDMYNDKCWLFSVWHIRKTDGWLGLYRGLGARLCSGAISAAVTNYVSPVCLFSMVTNRAEGISVKTILCLFHTKLIKILNIPNFATFFYCNSTNCAKWMVNIFSKKRDNVKMKNLHDSGDFRVTARQGCRG